MKKTRTKNTPEVKVIPEYLKNLKHFEATEFACSCCGEVKMDEHTINCLVNLREKDGQAMIINSAYRCSKHNKEVGGAPNSYHVKGMAIDVRRDGRDIEQFKKLAEACGFNGFGLYETFMHIDTRMLPTFWRG